MAQEYLIADFSGGINPATQPDKLLPNESLQLQNCRIDELGGVSITGASTLQNTTTYVDTASNANVHSIFVAPSLGAVAGVGQDVFSGLTLGGLVNALKGQNTSQVKMSAATSPSRIFFEIGGTAYVVGPAIPTPLLVDWAPPSAVVPTPSSPTTVATAGTATTGASSPAHWTNTAGIIGTSSGTATAVFAPANGAFSDYIKGNNPNPGLGTAAIQGVQITAKLNATSSASLGSLRFEATLVIGGVASGTNRSVFVNMNAGVVTGTFGGSADLFGNLAITVTQANASNFGVLITVLNGGSKSVNVNALISDIQFQFFQSSAASGLTAGTGGAGVLSGTYTYAATFVSGQGEESDVSVLSNAVTLASQQGSLTNLPVGDGRTVSRNIYRIGNTLTSLYLVGSIPDNVTTSFSDNTSDAAVLTEGVLLPGAVAGDQPNTRLGNQLVKYPCLHYDRVFWVSGNSIIWSKPLNAFAYPANNSAPVGNSTPIYGIVSKWGTLIIIKSDGIYLLTGNDETNFDLVPTESVVGTDQPFTICSTPNGVVFTNSIGAFMFNGAVSNKLTPKLDLLYRGENRAGFNAIETINKAVTLNFCAAANNEFYYFAYAEKNQPANNKLLVIDLLNGTITSRPLQVLSLASDRTTGFIYAGLANGDVVQIDDYLATADAFGALSWDLQTKYTDCNARGSNLAFWGCEFYMNTGGNTVTPVVHYDNGKSSETLGSFSTTTLQRVNRKFSDSDSRLAQTCSIELQSGATVVNTNGAPAISLTHIKLYYDVRAGRARTGKLNA